MVKISKSKLGTIAYRALLAVMIPVICSAGYFYAPQIYDLGNSLYTGTLAVLHGGTGTTTSTGTGSVVLSASPTLTGTPAIAAATGTSVTLTNASSINNSGGALPTPTTGNLLQIASATGSNANITLESAASSSRYQFRRVQGTLASPSALGSGANMGNLEAWGYGTTGYSSSARAGIVFITEQVWTDANQGAGISFFTTPNNTTTYAEKARFNNAGALLLGYTADQGGGQLLQVNSGIFANGAINSTSITMGSNAAPLCSATAPTVTGFGSSPSVPSNNGTCAFTVNVGTGGSASTGTVNLPSSTTGWVCTAQDVTTPASFITAQTGGATNTATFTNYSRTTGLAIAWTASDVLRMSCLGY